MDRSHLDDASYTQIKAALERAAVRDVPGSVRRRASEVFGDDSIAAEWLTTRIAALGGHSPIDTLMCEKGEEEALRILERIEPSLFS